MVNQRKFAMLFVAALFLAACAAPPVADATTLTEQELAGKRIFAQNCASCHASTPGAVIVGPSLFGIAETAMERVSGQDARTYIEISIIDPSAYVNEGFADLMPKTFGRTLTGDEMDSVIAYLFTLK